MAWRPDRFLTCYENATLLRDVMAILTIGPAEKEQIQNLISFAESNVMGEERIKRIAAGEEKAPGDDPRLRITLPIGYGVVFTFEQQPFGKARHISISIDRKGLPAIEAVNMILEAFGFRNQISKEPALLCVWIEVERAINVVEPLDHLVPLQSSEADSLV